MRRGRCVCVLYTHVYVCVCVCMHPLPRKSLTTHTHTHTHTPNKTRYGGNSRGKYTLQDMNTDSNGNVYWVGNWTNGGLCLNGVVFNTPSSSGGAGESDAFVARIASSVTPPPTYTPTLTPTSPFPTRRPSVLPATEQPADASFFAMLEEKVRSHTHTDIHTHIHSKNQDPYFTTHTNTHTHTHTHTLPKRALHAPPLPPHQNQQRNRLLPLQRHLQEALRKCRVRHLGMGF